MSFLDRWRTTVAVATRDDDPPRPRAGVRFDVTPADVDPALFGLESWETSWTGPAAKISRALAMQVPGVKRGRDIICQTIGGLPLEFIDKANVVHDHPLLAQPERDIPRVNTMTATLDDILFEGVAVWRIVATDAGGFPTKVRRLEPTTVDLQRENRVYVKPDGSPEGSAWEWVPDSQIIRFYGPTDPLLIAGARAIRTALALDTAASRYADDPMAQGYFRPTEGADPLVDEQGVDETDDEYAAREGNAITALVKNWRLARQAGGTGYVPAGLEYVTIAWDPAQLQLAEGRQHAVLEIARAMGIDPEDLGVSTTSRTYANSTQKREELRDYTLAPFAAALTDRLSMPDITPAAWRARVNYRSFIEADEKTRMETYALAASVGAYGPAEVQRREQLPASAVPTLRGTAEPAPAAAGTSPRPLRVVHEAEPLHTVFGSEIPDPVGFPDAQGLGFSVDVEARTIFGLVVPYGATSSLNRGVRYRFARGSLVLPPDQSRVKMRVAHGPTARDAVGYAMEFTDSPEGMWGKFKVAPGPEGDEALRMAAAKVWDGLSVGLRADSTFDFSTTPATVLQGLVGEVSLTPDPSFTDSRVHAVTASNHDREDQLMPPTVPPVTDPPTPPATPVDVSRETPPVTFAVSDLTEAIITAMGTMTPAERPVIVGNPHGVQLQVQEPAPYRFDGFRAAHCFSSDLHASLVGHDAEASARLDKFMELAGPQFNVTVANAATLNPNINRPDLYVDQKEYEYPLWSSINKGGLTDNTPFVLPKFNASSGLVADHTEGTEPSTGAFSTTSQTITPTPLSGKVTLSREVWDQGGNPQLDSLLWRQITRAYYEGLESATATFINALSPTTITITTAAADAALEASLTSQLVPLQYIRGGNRFRDFKVQVDLMKSLVAAKDTAGRKLFPVIGPQNATGTTSAFFSSVNVGGLIGEPAWALAASGVVSANSFLYDRADISGWASAPRKLTMDNIAVATVQIGVWGYKALACTDITGLRFIAYDPA